MKNRLIIEAVYIKIDKYQAARQGDGATMRYKRCYMAKYIKTKGKRRASAILALALTASLSLGLFSACTTTNNNTDDDDQTTASRSDTQLVKNGNFEFYSDNNYTETSEKRNLINSPDSWSRSTGTDGNGNSAPSSDATSGIINTADKEWANLTSGNKTWATKEDAAAHFKDEGVTAYDRLKFYKDNDIDSTDDFELYKDYNYTIDYDDVKYLAGFTEGEGDSAKEYKGIENPKTHDNSSEDTSVLMIHNRRKTSSTVEGTAQYYTSSTTVTLNAGTAAEISVWVKTDNLTHYEGAEATNVGGAYIGVTHTVGGTTLDQFQIKNINTKGVTENNGWKQYTVFVRASTFATSTFRIVLGLGFGSTSDMYETVNGFAFFDDLTCTVFDAEEEYETRTEGVTAVVTPTSLKDEKKFDTSTANYKDVTKYAIDLYAGFNDYELTDVALTPTEETYNGTTYTAITYPALNFDESASSYVAYKPLSAIRTENMTAHPYLQKVLSHDFEAEKFPWGEEEKVLMLLSDNGVPYAAKTGSITVEPNHNKLVSFFVKTNEMNGFTGAGVTLVDGDSRTSISSVDSTTLTTVDIQGGKEDIYNGWQQCFFFVKNDTDEDKTFTLEFNYGSTSIVGTNDDDYIAGYAAFTNFKVKDLSNAEYTYASTGDRAKSVTLTNTVESDRKFDNVQYSNPDEIKTGLALPSSFWGVAGGDKLVGGEGDGGFNGTLEGVNSGLLSSEYKANYTGSDWQQKLVTAAKANGITVTDEWWNEIIGSDSKQPLLILNGTEASYGYFAESRPTVSTSAYQRIAVRLKVSKNAKATVYLIDSGDLSSPLQYELPEYTYWYDDKGNVVKGDPKADGFDKKNDIVYYLQENGLYTTTQENKAPYYANLSAYDVDEETGNLVTKSETTAFYYNESDKKFYAYYNEKTKAYSTEVNDFAHENLRYTHDKTKSPEAKIEVDGSKTNGGWVTVSFYVATGNVSKGYRVEVWSGSRDGAVKNPDNSYVIFDSFTSSDASSNYSDLLKETTEKLVDELREKDATLVDEDDKILDESYAIYHTFTFYDSGVYLRYDKTLDENNTGNQYASYKQSEKTEAVAYLYYEEAITETEFVYRKFINFGATDVTVTADETNDDSDDDTDDDTDENPGNVWLLVASGSLAGVLVFAMVALLIRNIVKRVRRKKKGASKVKAASAVPAKKSKPAKEEKNETPIDENDPYHKS